MWRVPVNASASRLSAIVFTGIRYPTAHWNAHAELAERIRVAVAEIRFHLPNDHAASDFHVLGAWAALPADDHTRSRISACRREKSLCQGRKIRGRNRVGEAISSDKDGQRTVHHKRRDNVDRRTLRAALDEGRFRVFPHSPSLGLVRGEHTRRFEMLVRLLDAKDKLVMPQQFISSAIATSCCRNLIAAWSNMCSASFATRRRCRVFSPYSLDQPFRPTISDERFADWLVERISDCGVPGDWIGSS